MPEHRVEHSYWLVKSEPDTFSFDDLLAAPKRTTHWDGVRNPTAQNNLKAMKSGDAVFFYHSGEKNKAIVGLAEVAREAYPEPKDPKWAMVDLRAVEKLPRPVRLDEIKAT